MGIQDALVRSTTSVTDQANLVRKQAFPVRYLVFSSLAGAIVIQAAAVAILAVWVGFAGAGSIRPLPLAAAFLAEALVLLGPAFALATANVLFRDLSQFLGTAVTALFYLTPVLYHEALVPKRFAPALVVNPLRDVIALFRAGLIGTPVPPLPRLVLLAAVSAVVAWLGARFFETCRKTFADVL